MFKRLRSMLVTRTRHEAVIEERDAALTELEQWHSLANTFQRFLDGKETLGTIRGRLNAVLTTVDVKRRKEQNK